MTSSTLHFFIPLYSPCHFFLIQTTQHTLTQLTPRLAHFHRNPPIIRRTRIKLRLRRGQNQKFHSHLESNGKSALNSRPRSEINVQRKHVQNGEIVRFRLPPNLSLAPFLTAHQTPRSSSVHHRTPFRWSSHHQRFSLTRKGQNRIASDCLSRKRAIVRRTKEIDGRKPLTETQHQLSIERHTQIIISSLRIRRSALIIEINRFKKRKWNLLPQKKITRLRRNRHPLPVKRLINPQTQQNPRLTTTQQPPTHLRSQHLKN